MAYQVRYPTVGKKQKNGQPLRRVILTGVACFFFAELVRHCWPVGWQMLRQVFLPEDLTRAVSVFVEQLKTGTSAPEALSVFCQRIMEDVRESIH